MVRRIIWSWCLSPSTLLKQPWTKYFKNLHLAECALVKPRFFPQIYLWMCSGLNTVNDRDSLHIVKRPASLSLIIFSKHKVVSTGSPLIWTFIYSIMLNIFSQDKRYKGNDVSSASAIAHYIFVQCHKQTLFCTSQLISFFFSSMWQQGVVISSEDRALSKHIKSHGLPAGPQFLQSNVVFG